MSQPLAGQRHCWAHGALTTSDPGSRLHIQAAPGALNRYSFGLGATDLLLCDEYGTYVAATVADDEGLLAVVNVRGANLPGFEDRTPEPMVYENESAEERLARRKTRWTPAVLTEAEPNA